MNNSPAHTHIHILLDRSGSMQSIVDDVIGGFNRFLAEQQAEGPDARITLVQFDDRDPNEVILGGVPIAEAKPLTPDIFRPRGSTPLLDATAALIERARTTATLRAENGLPAERILFVSITDGQENASRRHTLKQVRELIARCEAEGWTFAFLSAALDAYADAESLGIHRRSSQAFDPGAEGTMMAFSSLSHSTSRHRKQVREADPGLSCASYGDDFFGDDKPAEEHRKQKDEEKIRK